MNLVHQLSLVCWCMLKVWTPTQLHHSEISNIYTWCLVSRQSKVKGEGPIETQTDSVSSHQAARRHTEPTTSSWGGRLRQRKKNPYQFMTFIAALLLPWQQRWKKSHIWVGGDAHYVCLILGLPWTRRKAQSLQAAEMLILFIHRFLWATHTHTHTHTHTNAHTLTGKYLHELFVTITDSHWH